MRADFFLSSRRGLDFAGLAFALVRRRLATGEETERPRGDFALLVDSSCSPPFRPLSKPCGSGTEAERLLSDAGVGKACLCDVIACSPSIVLFSRRRGISYPGDLTRFRRGSISLEEQLLPTERGCVGDFDLVMFRLFSFAPTRPCE